MFQGFKFYALNHTAELEGIPKGNWNTKRGFVSATRFGLDATQSLTRGCAEKTFGIRDGDEGIFYFKSS